MVSLTPTHRVPAKFILQRAIPTIVLLANAAYGGVFVVDANNGPGTDFVDLPPAIAAVAPFDTLLLRSGSYHTFVLDGKSLNFVADANTEVTIGGFSPSEYAWIKNLKPNDLVTFRGIRWTTTPVYSGGGSFTPGTAVLAENCAGQLWFENCSDGTAAPTLTFSGCPRVTIVHCDLSPTGKGASALHVDSSNVAIEDSTLVGVTGQDGGPGSFGTLKPSFPGSPAIVLYHGASLVLSGSTVNGGDGGDGYGFGSGQPCSSASNGGPGILMQVGTPAPILRRIGSTVTGGLAGFASCGTPALDATAIEIASGIDVEFPFQPMTLDVPSPLREGQAGSIHFDKGVPGTTVFLFLAALPGNTFVPAFAGTFGVASPFAIFGFGTLSGTSLTFPYTVPLIPAVLDEYHVFAQIASCTAQGACSLGNATQIIMLDSSL